jgi:hypothetical protein
MLEAHQWSSNGQEPEPCRLIIYEDGQQHEQRSAREGLERAGCDALSFVGQTRAFIMLANLGDALRAFND